MEKEMTVKEVVIWLNQYKHIQRDIQDIEMRITQLRLKYAAPSAISYSDMPKAHDSNHDLSEYAEKLEELEQMLIARHTKALGLSVQYIEALDHLSREEAYVIRRRYMDGAMMETIANEMSYSIRSAYYYKRKALRKLANIADHCSKSNDRI
jgi:DNA-directed RNA polymerase sigma subunit (sigma70/sigma32)